MISAVQRPEMHSRSAAIPSIADMPKAPYNADASPPQRSAPHLFPFLVWCTTLSAIQKNGWSRPCPLLPLPPSKSPPPYPHTSISSSEC